MHDIASSKTRSNPKSKKLSHSIYAIGALMTAMVTVAEAGYVSGAQDFTFFDPATKWNPGVNTAQFGGFPAPGGATWSIMGAGLSHAGNGFADTSHNTNTTTDIANLGFSQAIIESIIDTAMDSWALVSGFTNLGQVADGGVGFGATDASGGNLGDIRIGAIEFDGPGRVLAHAFQPGTEALGLSGGRLTGGSILGDAHFDVGENWNDSGIDGSFDLATVMLHEFGHSLGLGHSDNSTSIMFPTYAGANTVLGKDDIAGIQAIYGTNSTVVPVPAAVYLFMSGLGLLAFFRRKQTRA